MPDSAKKPVWFKRALLIISIVGPLAGAITTVATSIIDVRDRARKASASAEAGYETLAPAVEEIQAILAESGDWSEYANSAIDSLEQRISEQERRIIRLEAHIEILRGRRDLPEPAAVETYTGPTALNVDVEDDKPEPAPRAKRPVPQDISKARIYQQQRVELKCDPQDPLCGLAE